MDGDGVAVSAFTDAPPACWISVGRKGGRIFWERQGGMGGRDLEVIGSEMPCAWASFWSCEVCAMIGLEREREKEREREADHVRGYLCVLAYFSVATGV